MKSFRSGGTTLRTACGRTTRAGSGGSVSRRSVGEPPAWATDFDAWTADALVRNDVDQVYAGPGGDCTLRGLFLAVITVQMALRGTVQDTTGPNGTSQDKFVYDASGNTTSRNISAVGF